MKPRRKGTGAWGIIDQNRRVVFDPYGDAMISNNREDLVEWAEEGEKIVRVKIIIKDKP